MSNARFRSNGLLYLLVLMPVSFLHGAELNLASWNSMDIGAPVLAGSVVLEGQSAMLQAAGSGIGGKRDQFYFYASSEPGDFDVQVRVAWLKNTDLWAKAGLMLREQVAAESRFSGVFATPSGAGCTFQARETEGGAAAYQGTFPSNLPFTWLRLRRVGDVVTGFAGYDGRRWTVLGSKSIDLGTNTLFGLAVTSHSTNLTTARFEGLAESDDPVVLQVPARIEPLGPCSRRTALAITEIMFHPADRPDSKNLEFIEIYNSQPYYEDISGWKIDGDVQFTFPPGTLIAGGGFLVVAAVPADLRSAYALDSVLGPFTGKLANEGGKLRLVGERNAVLLEIEYNDKAPWPELADGSGHSLVLARPSYGEGDPRAWDASRVIGGSPGMGEAVEITAASGVRINECQLPDANGNGFVELFNAGQVQADLSGMRLGKSPESLPFVLPAGSKLAVGGFVHFSWAQLGFRGDRTGDRLYLASVDGSRFIDAVSFPAQVAGTSAGRWPNGATSISPLPLPTPGAANPRPRSDVVINEIQHEPISGNTDEEYVELYNSGSTQADLSLWEFTKGISFTFPQGTTIPAGGYLVVARNLALFRGTHSEIAASQIVGGFTGKLSERNEHLLLSRPVSVTTSGGKTVTELAPVCEAAYAGSGRWTKSSAQGGSTLERIDPRADGKMASNWADSDESAKAAWTTVEFTGVLDNGASGGGGFPGGFPGGGGRGGGGGTTALAPDSLHVILLGEGECLIDNVEVIGPGNTNRIANGTFEQSTAGWTFSGNHVQSSLETAEGDASRQSLHLRASGNGDTGANRVFVKLTQALAAGNTATLRARVKWIRGWPEILLRLHGNSLEAFGELTVPARTGTPGAKNSRFQANAGPGIDDVRHFPVVPGIDERVLVTARVDDPDGIEEVILRYRQDPKTDQSTVSMKDDGTDGDVVPGDGIFSGVIPAPGSAALVGFTIEAADSATPSATRVYPPNAAAGQECLIRFGDGNQSGAFGVYRLWVTQTNSSIWKNRPVLSNEPVESTFVYGNVRAVYNAGGRFAGSPYHQQFNDGPASQAHFTIDLPKDDRVLGTASFNKLHAPGNGAFDDSALQREQVAYWLARKSGNPWLHRRFFHFYVNGVKKQNLMEDTQVGSDDLVKEFWPGDTEGDLFKMQPWFEFADAVTQNLNMQSSTFVSIAKFTTSSNQLKLARYRWNWLVRGADLTANNYSNVLDFINVATDWTNSNYGAKVEKLVDVDEWMRFFAINHALGNWDSVGYRNAQNTYSYKPRQGRWELIMWDANIVLGNGGSDQATSLPLFTTGDPTLTRWFSQPAFRRRLLTAYDNLVHGPMQTELISPILDAKYAAFQEHGVTASSPESIKSWITSARNYIVSQINKETAPFAVTGVTAGTLTTLSGTGPLNMDALQVDGSAVPVTWTSAKAWTASFVIPNPTAESLIVVALDNKGQIISETEQDLSLARQAVLSVALQAGELVFEYRTSGSGNCQIQATPSLSEVNWETVASGQPANGTLQLRILLSEKPTQFYRVVEE